MNPYSIGLEPNTYIDEEIKKTGWTVNKIGTPVYSDDRVEGYNALLTYIRLCNFEYIETYLDLDSDTKGERDIQKVIVECPGFNMDDFNKDNMGNGPVLQLHLAECRALGLGDSIKAALASEGFSKPELLDQKTQEKIKFLKGEISTDPDLKPGM